MHAPSPRSDLVAVITGASRGLGAGMAEVFACEGVHLGLCARTRPESPRDSDALTDSVDVADAEAVDEFSAAVIGRFGRIDLWVNSAGVLAPIGPLATADPVDVHHLVDGHLLGAIHGSASFSRHVRSRPGGGVLVNISSGAATRPYEGWAAYCASKAAVEMLTEVIALEEDDHGLRAYALAPGLVDTDMQTLIRSTSAENFPMVDRFRQVHERGGLNSPDWVARFILDRLVDGATGPEGDRAVRLRVPDQHPPS